MKSILLNFKMLSALVLIAGIGVACGDKKKNDQLAAVPATIEVKPVQERRTIRSEYVAALDERLQGIDEFNSKSAKAFDDINWQRNELRKQQQNLDRPRAALTELRKSLVVATEKDWPGIADTMDKDLAAFETASLIFANKVKFVKEKVEVESDSIAEEIAKLKAHSAVDARVRAANLQMTLKTWEKSAKESLEITDSKKWNETQASLEKDLAGIKGRAIGSLKRAEWDAKYQEVSQTLSEQKEEISRNFEAASDSVKTELKEKWQAVQEQQAKLNERRKELAAATDEKWEEMKESFQKEWDEFQSNFSNFREETKEKFKAFIGK
ncbi:MAG: hypothetical protein J0L93_02905 [Deltaproteobacteria bacterium]|nr:hypothetical protein [Deltaproteobacteria bacterium]